MITMNMLGKVRRLYFRDGLSVSEIERRTGITRKTIRSWLTAPEGVEPKYRRRQGEIKIGPYAGDLVRMLTVDARRAVRERRTARKLYGELKAQGFDGDYSRVTEFIRRWRLEGGKRGCALSYRCDLPQGKRTNSTGAKSDW
jgi:transposase